MDRILLPVETGARWGAEATLRLVPMRLFSNAVVRTFAPADHFDGARNPGGAARPGEPGSADGPDSTGSRGRAGRPDSLRNPDSAGPAGAVAAQNDPAASADPTAP